MKNAAPDQIQKANLQSDFQNLDPNQDRTDIQEQKLNPQGAAATGAKEIPANLFYE